MKEFFKGPLFRALLALVAFVVLSLLVWFLGPFLSLGGAQPLGSVAVRVAVILLLLAGLLAWALGVSAKVAWSILGAAALSLLIWHGGPLLGLGSLYPLKPVWARVLCIVLVVLVLLVWGVYTLYKALQQDQKLVQRWLHPEGVKPALAREEVRHLKERAKGALSQLRQMHLSLSQGSGSAWAGVRRLFEGKRYLYELPWYLLIGQPGAGKSSVVVNAGLTFPLPDQMGAASARLMLESSSGTQNCDWWLTNEAVFLDTAGRYTAHAEAADEQGQQKNEAEWKGFLGVLRQVRPRAPINGALLVVDVGQLLQSDEAQRMALAAQLRARLEELRAQLGIRFPVYVVLSKADVIRGFGAYFSSLTAEARTQVWGFTLPWGDGGSALLRKWGRKATQAPQVFVDSVGLSQQVGQAFSGLVERVRNGVMGRLQEEFELDQRQSLYLLPYEMKALQQPLEELVRAVFAESRYDATQIQPTLRGVYLTSAMQTGQEVVAQPLALLTRLRHAFKRWGAGANLAVTQAAGTARKSFFLTDLMKRVVFAEAHLVTPNLLWEARFKLLRWLGHAVVLVLFIWLFGALALSHNNNRAYLEDVSQKTDELTQEMQRWVTNNNAQQADRVLNMAQGLPRHAGLDVESPALAYQYGLYVASDVNRVAQEGYGQLLDRLVLPHVVAHVEQVMREAVAQNAPQKAYDALRVYMLLYDPMRYAQTPDHARVVRQWVMQEWPNMQRLGNSTTMGGHLQALFSGARVVQSASAANEGLIRQVREYLERQSSVERLYERIKQSLLPQGGRDFSVARALGPQAALLFSRASGTSLERGVPGLFTYEGYHSVFSRQLASMLLVAQEDDEWVMGSSARSASGVSRASREQRNEQRDLTDEVRRRYLQEYADLWEAFLGDIRLASSDPSATLTYEVNRVRQLAAADSPLLRLARIATRQTTLSRPVGGATDTPAGPLDSAVAGVTGQAGQARLGARPEQLLERQWVDDRFAALREVVLGQSDQASGAQSSTAGLDGVTQALNGYYTMLVVADTAIAAGSLPPSGTEAATHLRIEAGKMPAPLREVLLGVSHSGADRVAQGASSILQVQARVQVDRVLAMLTSSVVEPCLRSIAGRYPFANSAQEVSAEDFNLFFAKGGAADVFFQQYLAPVVDTSARPWRYKTAEQLQAQSSANAFALGQMPEAPQTGPTLMGELARLLAQLGPNPDAFAHIAQVRDIFFRQVDGRKLSWRGEYKVVSLDERITEWVIDIDGQVQRYAHGPIQSVAIEWPGPRGGTVAELHAYPRVKPETSSVLARGPWAWMRLLEQGQIAGSTQPGKQVLEFLLDGRRAVLELSSAGPSPLNSPVLRNFACPARSA